MTVYVDDVRNNFGRMVMCHMWADTLEELLDMADTIGVQRKWIQGHSTLSFGKHREASWVHFDIALSKKDLALRAGAVLTDRFGPIEHTARLAIEAGTALNKPELVAYGEKRLEMVKSSRELRRGYNNAASH